MRGKAPQPAPPAWLPRITPAHAGKSFRLRLLPSFGRDHPRVCGEKRCPAETSLPPTGSPPACAGKRRTPKQCVFNSRDHPRMCGEKRSFTREYTSSVGSPPRMRGKVEVFAFDEAIVGITPAYAGKSEAVCPDCPAGRDHPRTCGEKFVFGFICLPPLGSPPHMRGKDSGICRRLSGLGITPAHAGKRPAGNSSGSR